MDAPLIPREMSSMQKAIIYTLCGGVAIYFIIVIVMSFIEGHKYSNFGNYLGAIGLVLLLLTTYFIYTWIPHDSVDDRVKYAIYAQGAVLILMATAVLMMSLQTTPCPACVCPACPPANKCDLSGAAEGQWFQMASCFDKNQVRNNTFIAVSATKECPKMTGAEALLEVINYASPCPNQN